MNNHLIHHPISRVVLSSSGASEGEVTLVIKNYIKPNDSVTLVYNRQEEVVQSIQADTYLSDPSVTISAQLAKLPPRH
jgi:hypothetical protein